MNSNIPTEPKIYHILHVDRLPSVLVDGCLWSDAKMNDRDNVGTSIGMNKIKARRLNELTVSFYPGLYVGQCVPFYFCPRSVMLYMMYKGNHMELAYHGGQEPIIHLEADLHQAVKWAVDNNKRWAFTLSNAAERIAEYRNDLRHLGDINWNAIHAKDWQQERGAKQAEFLLEEHFPVQLVERIGVYSDEVAEQVNKNLEDKQYKPVVTVNKDWYY